MKFRKRAVVIEAITFDELVAYGLDNSANIQNGMAWSFQYEGHGITHENDDCYLIPTLEGTMRFERGDMLITGVKGEIYPCKGDIFEMTYDSVDSVDWWKEQIGTGTVEVLPGFTAGYVIDPLESAIGTAASLITEHPVCAERMSKHLDDLLALQLKQLSEPVVIEHSEVGDISFASLSQGRTSQRSSRTA